MTTNILLSQINNKIFGWIVQNQTIQLIFGLQSKIHKTWIVFNETIYVKTPLNCFYAIVNFLKNAVHCQYRQLTDIIAIDIPKNRLRFSLNYILLSIQYTKWLYINIQTNELTSIKSISKLFSSGTIAEREIWDLFGIFFQNNLNLCRILTDYGFKGHALRKNFPLSGFSEILFSGAKLNIMYPKIILSQEKRYYNFVYIWMLYPFCELTFELWNNSEIICLLISRVIAL